MRRTRFPIAIAAAALATLLVAGPWLATLHGLSFDALVALRLAVVDPRHAPLESVAAVIALDEETYRRAPFDTTPKVMWTRDLVPVIEAVMAADARVLGFDLILPTTVAGQIRGFDAPFLQTLHRFAGEGRLVLGKVQHSLKPVSPAPGQRFAVGHDANMALVNLYSEADDIIRGVPLAVPLAGEAGPVGYQLGLAAELARRAAPGRFELVASGRLRRDGTEIPTVAGNNLLVDFEATQRAVPTYSLADLHACASAGNTQYFREHFAGKVVLLGSVLDVEDRKLTSLRFAAAPDSAAYAARCVYPPMAELHDAGLARDTIPAVYVHAFAVNDLLRDNLLVRLDLATGAAIVGLLALLAAGAAIWLPAAFSATIVAAFAVLWAAAAVILFERSSALPLLEPVIAMAVAFTLAAIYRITVADRDKRLLRQMFGLYLAPRVVDRLIASGGMPALGGEVRELTVLFSDLAGFSSIAENRSPDALVAHLNEYLTAMTDVIEAYGGFVDKYIGDAVVAVFGAPHRDDDHASNAVRAALQCQRALDILNDRWEAEQRPRLRQRIGINTGQVLVGNIGSRRRFNYTVLGDAVNIAARLEGANKVYGTPVLVSADTVSACRSAPSFREIDTIRVVGRDRPIAVYAPLATQDVASCKGPEHAAAYASALDAYRKGRFEEAAGIWQALAPSDPAAAVMLARARRYAAQQPDAWDGIYTLDVK